MLSDVALLWRAKVGSCRQLLWCSESWKTLLAPLALTPAQENVQAHPVCPHPLLTACCLIQSHLASLFKEEEQRQEELLCCSLTPCRQGGEVTLPVHAHCSLQAGWPLR